MDTGLDTRLFRKTASNLLKQSLSWSIPTHPLAGLSAIAIAAGSIHTCAIVTGGGVKCWGYNGRGQLGIGQGGDHQNQPADVIGAAKSTGTQMNRQRRI
jgi:alpha-tubulin suppressor-like RCC1 family protein